MGRDFRYGFVKLVSPSPEDDEYEEFEGYDPRKDDDIPEMEYYYHGNSIVHNNNYLPNDRWFTKLELMDYILEMIPEVRRGEDGYAYVKNMML